MQDSFLIQRKHWKLTSENYAEKYLRFQDRQAGVSLVYDAEENQYYYNAYCVEAKIVKELFSVEYSFLDEALETINDEFGTWELASFDEKGGGCGNCAAK